MRAERGRRLIEQTADLLSADYPLADLIERLCDLLVAAFGRGTTAFMALAAPDGRLICVQTSARSGKRRSDEEPVDPQSAAYRAFSGGQSQLVQSPAALYVPIARGDRTLGVLGLEHEHPGAFDQQDLRYVEAIARYLAISVRDQRAAAPELRRPVRPVFAYAAIVVFALLLSFASLAYAWVRGGNEIAMSAALNRAHANETSQRLARFVDHSEQLAGVTAALLGPVRQDRRTVENTLTRLLSAAGDPEIYGIGVWYEPYTFESGTRYYGPYVHRPKRNFRGAPQLTYEWMTSVYDFPSHYYYRLGRQAGDKTVFTQPYFDTDFTYVSAVRAFYDSNGRFAGVVTVDSVMPLLAGAVRETSALPGRIAYVTTESGRPFLVPFSQQLLAYARRGGVQARAVLEVPPEVFSRYVASLENASREDYSVTIARTGWVVHVSTAMPMNAQTIRLHLQIGILIAGIWLLAGLLLAAVSRAARENERNRSLEIREAELHTELAQRISMEEKLRESAYRDALTGLANRAALLEHLSGAIQQMQGWPDFFYAVLFLDLDRFNVVNDSLGHDAGDRLLGLIARRLLPLLRPEDLLARLGGDEFVFLLRSSSNLTGALELVERVRKALTDPFSVSGQEIFVSASIGIALGERRYERPEEVLRDADIAMYHAKRSGSGHFAVFERAMHERALAQLELESDLRRAIARHELFLEFQPIIAIANGSVSGFEALVRWRHPKRGRVVPLDFIPLAEQTGMIGEVDAFVIEEACRIAGPWVAEYPGLYLSVNSSAANLSRGTLPRMVSKALIAAKFPAGALKIEITETAVMENAEAARRLLKTLPQGVRIQIDDFGTGYSSLAYLQALPIDELKIDGSFVASMLRSAESAEIVRAIASLAQTLHLNVTAEGVERPEELEILRELGIEFAQGHLYTPALGETDALAYLRANSAARV